MPPLLQWLADDPLAGRPLYALLLVAAGFAAGLVNVVAGAGSIFTLGALIGLGLPAPVANGTNRVVVLAQAAGGLPAFQRAGAFPTRAVRRLIGPAILGALLGASVAVDLDAVKMERAIGIAMLALLVFVFWRPEVWLREHASPVAPTRSAGRTLVAWGAAFAIGVYGGFVQAGVGYFLVALFVWSEGMDLVHANAAKVLLNGLFTVFSLAVFAWHGDVAWGTAAVTAAGSAAGAWCGARVVLGARVRWLRWALAAGIALSAARMLGVF